MQSMRKETDFCSDGEGLNGGSLRFFLFSGGSTHFLAISLACAIKCLSK